MKRIKEMLTTLFRKNSDSESKLKKLSRIRNEHHPDMAQLPDHLVLKLRDGDVSIMRYPPFTEGCPAWVPAEYLLNLHDDKLRMLKGGVGFNEADYECFILPMLLNFTNLVHMLPASEHHHHRGFGGLLRHGLEVSVNALSYAQCEVFDARDLPGRRDQRSTVWRVAAIAAGLMHDAGKVLTDLKVVSEDGSSLWQPSIRSIPEWAELNNLERYFLRWVPDRHENHKLQSLTLIERVIPTNLREWILENGEDIYTEMTSAIAGEGDRQLTRMIKRADSASVASDMKDHGGDASRAANIGVPIPSLILDAIKRLIAKGYWEVNKPGSPIWMTTQGVFIKWADACPDAVKDVLDSGVKGIPRSSDSLCAILIDHGIATPDASGDAYWSVAIHMLRKPNYDVNKEMWFRCLHIPDTHHIFSFEQRPSPISVSIKCVNEITEYLIEKTAIKRSNEAVKKPLEEVAKVSPVTDTKVEGTKQSDVKKTPQAPSTKVVPSDEVRTIFGMSDKGTVHSELLRNDVLVGTKDLLPEPVTDSPDPVQNKTVNDEPEEQILSTEDMLVAMDFLMTKPSSIIETLPEKKDFLKDVLLSDIGNKLPEPEPEPEPVSEPVPVPVPVLDLEPFPTQAIPHVKAEISIYADSEELNNLPSGKVYFKLSEKALERSTEEFRALTVGAQDKLKCLFTECSELRKYTPEMRMEIPTEEGRFSQNELDELLASPLVFKCAVEGYTGLTYKYRKNWICFSYDASFLMSSFNESFIPYDVEIPEINLVVLKKAIQKFCLPEIGANHKSFYSLNKKAQTDVSRYLEITTVELLNILRVQFGSVRPSSSRANEIVFLGE